jgi:hypothetical protein
LRPSVVTRKTSFGSHSPTGAQAIARLLSLIETWERQGKDFFETAQATIAAGSYYTDFANSDTGNAHVFVNLWLFLGCTA